MPSLTMVHWLLVGNITSLFVAAIFLVILWRQQIKDTRQFKHLMGQLEQGHSAMSKSTIGMGRKIKQLESKVATGAPRAINDEVRFKQASKLVALGATASDLVQNLGVAQGEAELILSMTKKR